MPPDRRLPGSPGRNIELKSLDALLALIAEGSVTRAAERLGMTQPRMSDTLARLRRVFHDPLLVRSPHGMVPTERAVEIAAAIRAGLAQIDTAFADMAFEPARADRLFTLAMSEYLSLLLLPGLMRRLGQVAPNLRIAVKVSDPARIRDWLADGTCDMAFGFFMDLGSTLRASILFEDEPVCVVRGRDAAPGQTLTLDQYCGRLHAAMGGAPVPVSTMEQMVDAALAAKGRSRRIAIRVPSLPALAEIVAQTDLLATLPRHLASQLAARASVCMVGLPFRIPAVIISMVWHDRTQGDGAHRWLREQIRSFAKSERASW